MSAGPTASTDWLTRFARVKRQSLLLFFGGGTLMALVSLFLPYKHAPEPWLGQQFFVLTFLVGFLGSALIWLRPQALQAGRLDVLLFVMGNLCVLTATTAEVLRFGTQTSAMVTLWPVVFAAGFLGRRLLNWQFAVSALCIMVMTLVKANYVSKNLAWFIDAVVLALPILFTGLAVSFFREAATREAEELTRMASTDPLTGLSNRRELPKQFGELLTRAPNSSLVALVMLDVDHFKAINDRYGHHTGDLVLQDFAHTLRSHARSSDLVVRLGGEEFMWITTAQEPRELIYRVERLRETFFRLSGAKAVTVSAGAAYWPDAQLCHAEQLAELMQAADWALYRAKTGGRNRLCIDQISAAPLVS
ncbi:hypothetical protein Dxin01_01178 [Deinococcus xinjiangensis]|uniref:GGDEF domain-containing protein n=1 Tax=Deinococcus xinjiangensis TaxID=457454 RepID=A0ABP9V9S8_9DEIO